MSNGVWPATRTVVLVITLAYLLMVARLLARAGGCLRGVAAGPPAAPPGLAAWATRLGQGGSAGRWRSVGRRRVERP